MAAVPYKISTANSTNLQVVKAGQSANLKGIVAANAAAYAVFVKLYWGNTAPTVGTTSPSLTFEVPALGTTTGGLSASFPDGITNNGSLWMAVTKLGTDADTTVVLANDAVVTLLVE